MMTTFAFNELVLIKETCLTYLPINTSRDFRVIFFNLLSFFYYSEITFDDISIPDSDIQLKV